MAIVSITKKDVPGGCTKTDEDGYVQKIEGIYMTETRIFGVPVLKKLSATFVKVTCLFGVPIKLVRQKGWVLYLEAKP